MDFAFFEVNYTKYKAGILSSIGSGYPNITIILQET